MPIIANLLSQRVPIEETRADHKNLLSDLQCNILSGHSRSQTHYFFLRFDGTAPKKVKTFLRDLAAGQAFSKHPQGGLESELMSRARRLQGRAAWADLLLATEGRDYSCNLFLTARCYTEFLTEFAPPSDPAFKKGLKNRDQTILPPLRLNDHAAHTKVSFDALYVVSYNPDEVDWKSDLSAIESYLKSGVKGVEHVAGYVLRHPQRGYPIEPFGYRDAVSQPLFYMNDLASRRGFEGEAATAVGGKWSSLAPLSLALVPDPNGGHDYSCGTYVAYRKLRQDVRLFYQQAATLAAGLPPQPDGTRLSREDIADRLIGRRVDGHPLDPSDNYNDFNYPDDSICPRHAHARKMNPRNGYVDNHRIVRRATVYGPRLRRRPDGRPVLRQDGYVVSATGQEESAAGTGRHDPDIGLMFFCCQANIAEQFEFLQGRWANDPSGGADTIVGQLPPETTNKIGFNQSGLVYPYQPVVKLLEGDYFFAPSLSFFSKLV